MSYGATGRFQFRRLRKVGNDYSCLLYCLFYCLFYWLIYRLFYIFHSVGEVLEDHGTNDESDTDEIRNDMSISDMSISDMDFG